MWNSYFGVPSSSTSLSVADDSRESEAVKLEPAPTQGRAVSREAQEWVGNNQPCFDRGVKKQSGGERQSCNLVDHVKPNCHDEYHNLALGFRMSSDVD